MEIGKCIVIFGNGSQCFKTRSGRIYAIGKIFIMYIT